MMHICRHVELASFFNVPDLPILEYLLKTKHWTRRCPSSKLVNFAGTRTSRAAFPILDKSKRSLGVSQMHAPVSFHQNS